MKDKLAAIRDDLAAVNARLTAVAVKSAVAVMRKDLDDQAAIARRLSDELHRAHSFIGASHTDHRPSVVRDYDKTVPYGTCRACDYFRNNRTRP